MKLSSTRKSSAGSSRVRKDLPRTEEAWYVIYVEARPYMYWSCVKSGWVPWIAGDEVEAYYTEDEAEQVAVTLTLSQPSLAGRVSVLRRA